jgi:hypothetical protein
VTVNKANPTVTAWPTASAITYGQTLASSTLSGGSATPAGSFAFTNPTLAPGAGTAPQSVTFTPTDTTDYNTASGTVSVTVNKANPTVTWPTASAITYGQTLASSTLSGGSANTPGSFAFTNPTLAPGAGTAPQSVTFTPTDTTDYNTASSTVSVTVNKATLTITATNQTKAFGQTLTFAGTEFIASGLVNGDTVSSVTLTSAGAVASATVAGSPYPIVPSAAVGTGLGNYTITYVDGFLTVTSATSSQPIIQSAAQVGSFITFTWSATPSVKYQIQYTTNLSQNVWANLDNPITATGSTLIGSDTIANGPTFYRVMVVP